MKTSGRLQDQAIYGADHPLSVEEMRALSAIWVQMDSWEDGHHVTLFSLAAAPRVGDEVSSQGNLYRVRGVTWNDLSESVDERLRRADVVLRVERIGDD